MIGSQSIDKIFSALDKQIGIFAGKPIAIVVCGGTALAAMGLIERTTKDVDVLGEMIRVNKKSQIKKIDRFPKWFADAADIVKRDFALPENWINSGPTSQVDSGLPEGFNDRLTKRKYGKYLTVYFISRVDQIYFKLYAALDRGGYHVEDLKKLNPSKEELSSASYWVLTQDVSEGFRLILKDFLSKMGYDDLSKQF